MPIGFVLTGPAAGIVGVPTPIVVTPDAAVTDTVNLTDNAGGEFAPASLSWADSNLQQTSFYTPSSSAGTALIEATSLAGGTVAGSPLSLLISLPFPQAVAWPDLWTCILDYLSDWGIFGPNSTMWAVDPDSVIQWPAGPAPFALLQPLAISKGENDGMGRFGKIWHPDVNIHVVVLNVLDAAYMDTTAVQSSDVAAGAYNIAGMIVDALEQAYLTTPSGRYVIEYPESTRIGTMERFKQSNDYIRLPVTFRMMVAEQLPSTIMSSGLPD